MGFGYENVGNSTYFVYEFDDSFSVDTVSQGMLTNNKIAGVAQTLYTQLDDKKYLKYNVSAKITLKQFFSTSVDKKALLDVFHGVIDAMNNVDEYMIDAAYLLLDMDYIFVDVSTHEVNMLCVPVSDSSLAKNDLKTFIRNIMFSTQFDSSENCDYIAKIINYINGTADINLNGFKQFLDSFSTTGTNQIQDVISPVASQQANAPMVNNNNYVQSAQPQVPNQGNMQQPVAQNMQSGYRQQAQPTVPQMAIPNATPQAAAPEQKKKKFGLFKSHEEKAEKKNAAKASNAAPMPQVGFAIPGQKVPVNNTAMQQPQPQPPVIEKKVKEKKVKEKKVKEKKVKNQAQSFGIPAPNMQPQNVPMQNMQPQNAPMQNMQPQSAPMPNMQPQNQAAMASQLQAANLNSNAAPAYGETTVLGQGYGETTVLNAGNNMINSEVFLIRKRTGEKVVINKPVFRIGKEKSYVDYFIADNTAISRSHANIVKRDNDYYLVDTNSTNHTYVNGNMIQSNIEVKLGHGDRVRLANEDFDFNIF